MPGVAVGPARPEILSARMTETLHIPGRYSGPPGSANGGYTCGRVAELVGAEEVEVSLRHPPPLETPLAVVREDDRVERTRTTSSWPRAGPRGPCSTCPTRCRRTRWPTPRRRARAGRQAPLPTCFVCGPRHYGERRPADLPGRAPRLRGPVRRALDPDVESVSDGEGWVRPEDVWAALDCPQRTGGQLRRRTSDRAGPAHRAARLPGARGRTAHDPVLGARARRPQAPRRRPRSTTPRAACCARHGRSGSSCWTKQAGRGCRAVARVRLQFRRARGGSLTRACGTRATARSCPARRAIDCSRPDRQHRPGPEPDASAVGDQGAVGLVHRAAVDARGRGRSAPVERDLARRSRLKSSSKSSYGDSITW